MNIETLYLTRLSWNARNYEIFVKIEKRIDDITLNCPNGIKVFQFTGNAACEPYYEIIGPNRDDVEKMYQKIERIIMSYKSSIIY